MDIQEQADTQLQKVADLIKDIKFAMLTTSEPNGTLRSRPLSTIQMDAEGTLWFFTSLKSPKIDDIEQNSQVNLSYADPDKQDYVSISGTAETVQDKDKMRALWSLWIKPWFPEGLDDPNLTLLKITIDEAEYWDAPGNPVRRIYGLTKALSTGKTDALGENKQIDVRH